MAADTMNGIIQEARKNKFSSMGTSLSDDDMFRIWEGVSGFIERNMQKQKGVHIPNFGTFSFVQKKLDIGGNKFVLIQRPVFQVGEKFCQTHCIKQTKHHVTGSVPVVTLNYSALTMETPFERDQVESCVREMVGALSRSVASSRAVEFTFPGLGRLQVRDMQLKFKFYKDFINSFDTSGKIIASMQDRPGTADSVMTDRPASRPFSVSLPLPKILDSSGQPLASIPEDGVPEDAPEYQGMGNPYDENSENIHALEAELQRLSEEVGLDKQEDTRRSTSSSRASSRMAAPLAMATQVNFGDLLPPASSSRLPKLPTPPSRDVCDSAGVVRGTQELSRNMTEEEGIYGVKNYSSGVDITATFPPGVALDSVDQDGSSDIQRLQRELCADSRLDLHHNRAADSPATPTSQQNSQRATLTPPRPPPVASRQLVSACGHPSNAGQELCYLCHQRQRRNQPVSFGEEIARRDEEENKLLQAFQELKDAETIVRDQENLLAKRHDSQKVSAFNLGVSEAVRSKKSFRDPNFYSSYLFQHRPLTPSKVHKQVELSTELGRQVNEKASVKENMRADEAFLERLEQVQLAEDLAAQREQFIQERSGQKEMYRRALSAQLRYKPVQLPEREPDSTEPVFGKNDMSEEKLLERRRRAQEVLSEQLESVTQKKREAILRRLQEQKREEEVVKRAKEDLMNDRAARYRRHVDNRRGLEDEWSKAADAKRENEMIDRLRLSTPGGILHEQCDKYHRCCQCRRKMSNIGESNLWSDSYYIPGSRYIC